MARAGAKLGTGYRIDLEAACGLAVNTNMPSHLSGKGPRPRRALAPPEANLHANGAISYLVGGPVSRMLVGVSTLALRLGIRPGVPWIRALSPGCTSIKDGVTVTTAVTRAATQRRRQFIGSLIRPPILDTRVHATEHRSFSCHEYSIHGIRYHRPCRTQYLHNHASVEPCVLHAAAPHASR